jgi:hypothetical protein
MDVGDDNACGFSLHSVPLQTLSTYLRQPWHQEIFISTKVYVNRMARWLEGNTREYCGRGKLEGERGEVHRISFHGLSRERCSMVEDCSAQIRVVSWFLEVKGRISWFWIHMIEGHGLVMSLCKLKWIVLWINKIPWLMKQKWNVGLALSSSSPQLESDKTTKNNVKHFLYWLHSQHSHPSKVETGCTKISFTKSLWPKNQLEILQTDSTVWSSTSSWVSLNCPSQRSGFSSHLVGLWRFGLQAESTNL